MSSSGADNVEAAVLEGGARSCMRGGEITPKFYSLTNVETDVAPGVEVHKNALLFWRLPPELTKPKGQVGGGGKGL